MDSPTHRPLRPRTLALLSFVLLPALAFALASRAPVGAQGGSAATEPIEPETTLVGTSEDGLNVPRDLSFHPNPERPNELWVVNRADDSTTTFFDPGTDEQVADHRKDRYANHFMEEVSSIAFGQVDFATCQESRNTYDGRRNGNDFMGPTLWPGDLSIYARVNQGGALFTPEQIELMARGDLCGTDQGGTLGSHIDMNHQSPDCMGIEHHEDNAYWVFDGHNGHIVYYDFQKDHGPGGDDHSDAIVRRYVEAEVLRVPDVVSHLALDRETGWLYVADTGNARVFRMDTESGVHKEDIARANEPLEEFSIYEDVAVEDVITEGLEQPAGIHVQEGRLFVSDHATGQIVVYALDGFAELARLDTGAEGLMGILADDEGRVWYVDAAANELRRVDAPTFGGEIAPTEPPPPTATDTATPLPTSTPTPTATPTPDPLWLPWTGR